MGKIESIESLAGHLRRTVNTGLKGGVAPDAYAKKRMEEIARELADMRDPLESAKLSQTVNTDHYSARAVIKNRVSIERAAIIEEKLKQAIDKAILKENIFPSEPGDVGNGVPPCQLAKREKWS